MHTTHAAHSVLFTPELLRRILEDTRFLDHAGLVCKAWREVVLDIRYKTADLEDVLPFLGPMTRENASELYVSASSQARQALCPPN